jgi:hypothetical protein
LVVSAVILADAVVGNFRLMFPFVDVIVYEPLDESDSKFAVTAPFVEVAVTPVQEAQVKSMLPFVSVRIKLVDAMLEA